MTSPPPPGAVVRYAYLWADEQSAGAEEGRKDRPAMVFALATFDDETGRTKVLVAAITHAAPSRATDAVELPAATKQQLGLDDEASWIVTTEANAFIWPGPDVRPIPGPRHSAFVYGVVPRAVLRQVVRSYLANRGLRRTRIVDRD